MADFELHTDRLKRETGNSISCTVLLHDLFSKKRMVVLSSIDTHGQATPQAIAFTRLAVAEWDTETMHVDSILRSGHLMGETFRKQGKCVTQNRLFRFRLPLLTKYSRTLFDAPWWRLAEVECYEFWGDNCLYGTIVEIKNPRRQQEVARPALGRWHYWKRKGLSKQLFTAHLVANSRMAASLGAHSVARLWGWLASLRLTVHALYHMHMLHTEND